MKRVLLAVVGIIGTLAFAASGSAATQNTVPPPMPNVTLVDQPFKCTNYPQPLKLGTVKVTITVNAPQPYDAIKLSGECSGSIARIEVDTWIADGVKVGDGAHDLTIGGGYIAAHAHGPEAHQDGIQVMGGARITFSNLLVNVPSSNNAALFINGDNMPTDVVCDHCMLVPGNKAAQIGHSVRSGIRNSVIYSGKRLVSIGDGAVDPVSDNNIYPDGSWPSTTGGF